MNLLVVSHTPHYRREGQIVGWGPTVREIDHLATLFDRVIHVAPLHGETAPASALPYHSRHIELRAVPPSGGRRLREKVGILTCAPAYARTILRALRSAEVVHIRCPANISFIALLLTGTFRSSRQRWIKYAGDWQPKGREAWSYGFQRWWLRQGWHRGLVTVNGEWPNQPGHVRPFFNPCLTDEELADARACAERKELSTPMRLIFAGRLESEKGAGRAIEVLARVRKRGIEATLDLVGDGPERADFEALAERLGVASALRFHGWFPRQALSKFYAAAHIMMFPTRSEGWPKALSEAMAYGVVPLAGKVSSIPQYLARFRTGKAIAPLDLEGFCRAIVEYHAAPSLWKGESQKAAEAAAAFTYSRYVEAVRALLKLS